MEVKVIKKGTNSNKENNSTIPDSKPSKTDFNNLEKKVEHNILNWISDLRKKKSFEFLRTEAFLTALRG